VVGLRSHERQERHEHEQDKNDDASVHTVKLAYIYLLAQIQLCLLMIVSANGFLDIELRHLAALQAVAEEGSFGRAAKRLGYTQSAISQQIAALERIVDARLVERPGGPRRVYLTEAGEMLLRHADGIVARLHAAQADLAALARGAAGPLRIGTYQSVGNKILPALLRRFSAQLPDVQIELRESHADDELLSAVERGELDLTFTMLPPTEGPFETLELMRDPYVLLVPATSPLAGKRHVSLREIGQQPLVTNKACRSVEEVHAHLRARGIEPNVTFRSDDNGTVQGVVAAGLGVALVPRLTVDETDAHVAVIDLVGRVPDRIIGVAWHRDRFRTQAAEAFAAEAHTLCAELSAGKPVAA
jgi:molybdate transport repressor ModE-like protein